jgi:hypothetical protein
MLLVSCSAALIMLSYYFLKQRGTNYIKNNFYFDYGLKLTARVLVYGVLVQLAFFFAEKYIIEYYTRFSFNYSAVLLNKAALSLNHRYMFFYVILFSTNVLAALL